MDNSKGQVKRREFLRGTAAGLVASQLKAAPKKELQTAHIGVGRRGGRLLGEVLAQANVKVSAVCDIDPQARDKALSEARRDSPRSYTEWREILDLQEVDAVIIGTPCYLHAEMAAACLDAGKYVYCEKPLGITPEQVDLVLRADRLSSAFLQIGQQRRYRAVMREVVRRIHEEGVLGRTFVIKAQRHSTPARPGSRTREGSNEQRLRPDWYDDVRLSGDLIVENAVHNLDESNWIAGSRPISAFGHGKKYLPEPIPAGTVMMDGFSVEYVYQNDIHLDYSQLYLHPRSLTDLPNGQWYAIFGEAGAIFATGSSAVFHSMYGDSEPVDLLSPEIRQAKENAMEEFFAAIRENRRPFADVKVGATAALTAIMGREAIYKKRMVTWEELGVEV